jgi:hypothetical protein
MVYVIGWCKFGGCDGSAQGRMNAFSTGALKNLVASTVMTVLHACLLFQ